MALSTAAGLLLTAGALGVTHAIEPDHVAGITTLTYQTDSPRLSALVGGCFAAGHALLVVLWIGVAYLLFGMTTFPPVFEDLGLLSVGIVLSLLSLYLGVTGGRRLLHQHRHSHGDEEAHYHLHLLSGDAHEDHGHEHGILRYLKIGTVGALFTLSPPVSMIAFVSVTLAESGAPLIVGIVATYTVAIVTTMAVVGGSAGAVGRFLEARGARFHSLSQLAASVLVLGFAVNLLLQVGPGLLA